MKFLLIFIALFRNRYEINLKKIRDNFGPVVLCARESRKWADVSYLQMLELQCYISEFSNLYTPSMYSNTEK